LGSTLRSAAGESEKRGFRRLGEREARGAFGGLTSTLDQADGKKRRVRPLT
jgi:hypothetical protein